MAKYKSKSKQNYRKKSKGKRRRKSMKKRGGNGDENAIFIKFLPYAQQISLTEYSASTDTDKIIAHLSLGEDESKKVGDLRQFTGDSNKYIYLYLFDHNTEATKKGDGSNANYTFLNYNADKADKAEGDKLNKFLTLIYYPRKGETRKTKLTLSKIHCEPPFDPMNPNIIKLDHNKKAILIYEIISNGNNVGYIMRCTDDTHTHKEGGKQIKHDLAMINLTDLVPQETEEIPQNWFYEPFETTPNVCPLKVYKNPVAPKSNQDKFSPIIHDFERVKIFTKDFK